MQTVQTQLTNMANGRPMNEFLLQALKQRGLTEQNAQTIDTIISNFFDCINKYFSIPGIYGIKEKFNK